MKHHILTLILCLSFASKAKVLHVQNKEQLKEKINQQPAVIKFSATWCGPCQMAKKPFKKISDMPEFSHIAFIAIDTDQQQNIASAYNVTALPTFLFIRDGSIIEKAEGLIDANSVSGFKQNLAAKLNNLFTQQEPAPTKLHKEKIAESTKKISYEKPAPLKKKESVSNTETTKAESILDQISNWINSTAKSISNRFRSFWGS